MYRMNSGFLGWFGQQCKDSVSLNPYCNGICSVTRLFVMYSKSKIYLQEFYVNTKFS